MDRLRVILVAPLAILVGACGGAVWGIAEGISMAIGEMKRGWK